MTLINLVLFGFICLCNILALHLTIKILRPQVVISHEALFSNPHWKVIRVISLNRVKVISTAGKENNKIILWLMSYSTVGNWIYKLVWLITWGLFLTTDWVYLTLIIYCTLSIAWFLIAVNNWKRYKKVFGGCYET